MLTTFNYMRRTNDWEATHRVHWVRQMMALHMLKLNGEKTKMMIFTSKRHLKTYGGCSLTIGVDTVSPSDSITNLGVHMD